MNNYGDYENEYRDDFDDIRKMLPKLRGICTSENEEGDEEEIEIEIDPTLLEIVDTQVYPEKSDDSMGEELEHTLEGEIDFEGDSYYVTVKVWEYPINAVDNYEVESIEKI